MVADLAATAGLVLAVRRGRPLTPVWWTEEPAVDGAPLVAMARWSVTFLEAPLEVQAHTFQRVTVPDLEQLTADQVAGIVWAGCCAGRKSTPPGRRSP